MTVHTMTRPLDFTGYDIPDHTKGALRRYVEQGLMPGSFLEAVLTNDLMGATGRADPHNIFALKEICMFVYNEIPATAWGSRERMEAWCAKARGVDNLGDLAL